MDVKAELNLLVSKVCKAEGKKSQVKAGDVREVLKVIAQTVAKEVLEVGGNSFSSSVTGLALVTYAFNTHQKLKEKEDGNKNVEATSGGDVQPVRGNNKQSKSRSGRNLNAGKSRRGSKGKRGKK